MPIKKFFVFSSIKNDKLERIFLLAFVLTSLIPLLLLLFIVNFLMVPKENIAKDQVDMIVFFLGCASLVGFYMLRRMVNNFTAAIKKIKKVANGDLNVKIDPDGSEEIDELSDSFRRIIQRLEENVEELKRSKLLLQSVLSRVSEAVSSFQNIDKFLDLIILTAIDALGARQGRLMLLNQDNATLSTKVSFGNEAFGPNNIGLGEGIFGSVARNGKPYSVTKEEAKDSRAFVAAPLIYGNKVIGVFALSERKTEDNFSPDDMLLLKDLSGQLAIAFENYRLNADAERTYVETITALAKVVEARDNYTRGHTKRVGDYCMKLAKEFNLDEETIKMLYDASNLHDIGKIGIPDSLLHKTIPLTDEETRIIQQHPIIGESIMKPIRSLSNLSDLVRHHHEQLDGNGYPDGLKGEQISLALHIMIVADVFDAMTSDRPYRKAISFEEAKAELRRYSGIRYHQEVVEKFLKII